jgi:sugar phosphate permease
MPLALSHATYNIVLRTTFTFTPSFLVEYKGLDIATAGFLTMVLPFAGIFTKIGSGYIVEMTGTRYGISGATALSAIFLVSLIWCRGNSLIAVNLVILGLTLYSFSPIIYSSTTSSLPSKLKAMGLGVVTIVGNLVGAVSTAVVGALIDSKGYSFTFLAISVVTLVSSMVIFVTMSKRA